MNYITNASSYRVCTNQQIPKIHSEKPKEHYYRTEANADLLLAFFKSNAFKEILYLYGIMMLIEINRKTFWDLFLFKSVHYKKDL